MNVIHQRVKIRPVSAWFLHPCAQSVAFPFTEPYFQVLVGNQGQQQEPVLVWRSLGLPDEQLEERDVSIPDTGLLFGSLWILERQLSLTM